MDLQDQIINSRFHLQRKIGKGSFGQVFLAQDKQTSTNVAVKVELASSSRQVLLYEAKIMRNLQSVVGLPKVLWSGIEGNHSFLAMELLGANLNKRFELCGKKLGVKDWVSVGLQVVERLEDVHNNCYLHRDIKPENFALGLNVAKNRLFLIDFGLAKKFCDPKTTQHIPYRENKTLTGTARYSSINSHMGVEQSRRDDLESALYLMVFLFKGELPWQGISARSRAEKYGKIAEKKVCTKLQELCDGMPQQVADMIKYVRALRFEEDPDYAFLREGFQQVADAAKVHIDGLLDWKPPAATLHPPKEHRKHRHRKSVLSIVSSSAAVSELSERADSDETRVGDLPTLTDNVRHAAMPGRVKSLPVREQRCQMW